jgi:hypothetical protein
VVVVLARPLEERHGEVLALLADGESWSSSALALGASQRSVQRALDALAATGCSAAAATAARCASCAGRGERGRTEKNLSRRVGAV